MSVVSCCAHTFLLIIMHFRQDPLITSHLETTGGSFTHVYKGKTFTVTKDTVDTFDTQFIQSLSTRLRRQNGPRMPMVKIKPQGGQSTEDRAKAPGTDDRQNKSIIEEKLIEAELKRLATKEFMVEDRLHYPRVFRRLLSQPHLAFEEKKLVPETKTELYLYVDKSVGYNSRDNGFHATMIRVADKIKGITVFSAERLQFKGNYYWEHVTKHVPKGKTVLVFTQGCGGTGDAPVSILNGYNIHFCTHFQKGDNCGCSTIRNHENSGFPFHFHYGLDTPSTLKSLDIG